MEKDSSSNDHGYPEVIDEGEYKFEKYLGSGGLASVCSYRDKSGTRYAVKWDPVGTTNIL